MLSQYPNIFPVMCTSGEQINGEDEIDLGNKSTVKNEDKFGHLYREKIYYISKRNNQTICTGYRPDCFGCFKLRIRLDDHRYADHLTLTLFQFVSLMQDLRNFISPDNLLKALEDIDATLRFSLKDINVPKVTIEVDASYSVPNLFQLNLPRSKGNRVDTIVIDRKTVQRLIDSEGEIINTIETLEDGQCNFLFDAFIKKCVEHLKEEEIEMNSTKIYNEIKSIYKTGYQSEVFLKFWPLINKLIQNKLSEGSSP